MTFGEALEAVKLGRRIARAGWNGKGMFVFYVDPIECDEIAFTLARAGGFESPDSVPHGVDTFLCLYSAAGSIVPGWLASQTDMLARDWAVLP